jgi:hypothetical protein
MYLPSYLTLAAKGLPINGLKLKSKGSFAEFTPGFSSIGRKARRSNRSRQQKDKDTKDAADSGDADD